MRVCYGSRLYYAGMKLIASRACLKSPEANASTNPAVSACTEKLKL